ncbi:MAG: XTP/dITP diphosphatase [Candidatus Odinarchaeia archaeon]
MKVIYFATGNKHKVIEAAKILSEYDIKVNHLPVEKIEIQSNDLCKIATFSASEILKKYNKPIFVEDTGLFIEALNGFPGPYSSYVFKTIGNEGIIKLLKGIKNRRGIFKTAIAYYYDGELNCVISEVPGEISDNIRGDGWGYDPIFIPLEGDGKTYAQMGLNEKNKLSHRYKALKLLAEQLK